ncbi:cysteine-rich receptor-like protein kinase 25 [Gastrolobium bilobum]|uniref:cysteine-rich receptor-like protein kinase 25 n=1 Tax=Gastrolobium bilobum TaxID=150636 RepID=UPI002AB03919|nr:cysteine-rich receptor-like protein kinase 25 [Gastrolobium bilobum]
MNDQCEECLQNAIGTLTMCCGGKQGARAMLAWCNIRYDLYKFYYTTETSAAPPLVPSHPPPSVGDESGTIQSLQFNLATIEAATNKFSYENKIGKRGFGEVYEGVLLDGREIAVKKLSQSSRQGVVEFKNEVLLIAKLQHRNLVTLLGFCLEEQEKMLIYEFVPNKSLDYFLFDNNMNPKNSDFGMARMVAIDQDQGNTNRVVGTFGYMSPEYIKYGQFSEKSDIFSFGVIVLEVIIAKRNAHPLVSSDDDSLLAYYRSLSFCAN